MNKQQKFLHFISLPFLLCLCICFYILKGNIDTKAEIDESYKIGLNIEIPKAQETELSESRLDAIKKEELRISREKRRENMECSSFEWLDINPSDDESDRIEHPSRQANVRQDQLISEKTQSEKIRKELPPAIPDFEKQKESIMREKRAKLEKELGMNFSDYGYKKYEKVDDNNDNNNFSTKSTKSMREEKNLNYNATENINSSGFYGLEDAEEFHETNIRAVIHGEHKDVNKGSIIKIRLLEDVLLGKTKIPQNTFIYGRLGFSDGRATIKIENINYKDYIIPFAASIYDKDGFEGIYIPDNTVSDTKKDAAGKTISGLDLRLTSPNGLLNTAANAVTGAIKSATQAAVREPKITISSNYSITLKRQNENH
ncbi:MAG: conjugative transposon protein TraM [Bacteroidia bacterium]|nr:conjugative transposon protein TraM [Bacteroidia bacterium]